MSTTLLDLLAETHDTAVHDPGGSVQVFGRDPRYWRLSDFLVSSAVSGPSLIMVPRVETMADRAPSGFGHDGIVSSVLARYCGACVGTLDGRICSDGVCDGCGHRAFDPE